MRTFGQQIKWFGNDLFGVVGTYPYRTVLDTIPFTDNTVFDDTNSNFGDSDQAFTQGLVMYQVLNTDGSYINSVDDNITSVKVNELHVHGTNTPSLVFSGEIDNLLLTDKNNPDNDITIYNNPAMSHGWTVSSSQENKIDSSSISFAWIYDSITKEKLVDLEVVDLSMGILPQSIAQYLDYSCDIDPAVYSISPWTASTVYSVGDRVLYGGNVYTALYNGKSGNMFGKDLWNFIGPLTSHAVGVTLWGSENAGKTWFKTAHKRVVNAQVGTVSERAQNWNEWFPNENIVVYEWVSSSVSPENFISNNNNGYVDSSDIMYTYDQKSKTYGFWVYGKTSNGILHNQSVSQLSYSISNIPNSGIPMISALDTNTIASWNINNYIASGTSILHIEYEKESADNTIHNEFALISNDGSKSWINTPIYSKFLDSICGYTESGLLAPDYTIPSQQQIGILNNPIQSLFENRVIALKIYFNIINATLANVAAASSSIVNLLSNYDPAPTSGFDEIISNRAVLDQLDIAEYPENYKILISSDDTITSNGWSIVRAVDKEWRYDQCQTFNLTSFWEYANWYSSSYVTTSPTFTLNTLGELPSISYGIGDIIKVTDGNVSIYQVTTNELNSNVLQLEPIFIENGTIQFLPSLYDFEASNIGFGASSFGSTPFDNDPYIAIRAITNILNTSIFVGDQTLLQAADDAFYAMIRYMLYENKNLDWLFKTSFVKVEYNNRDIMAQGNFVPDNQDMMIDFVNETTPFHTRIRTFKNTYSGTDYANVGAVDYDLPSQYDTNYYNLIHSITNNPKMTDILQTSLFDQTCGTTYDSNYVYITSNSIPNYSITSLPYTVEPQNLNFGFARIPEDGILQYSTYFTKSGEITLDASLSNFSNSASGGYFMVEQPIGSIDGVNKTFYLTGMVRNVDTLIIALNSQVLANGTDYTLTGQYVLLNFSPKVGDALRAYYLYSETVQNGYVSINLTSQIAPTDVTYAFTLNSVPSPASSLKLYYNGILAIEGPDFTLSGVTVTTNFGCNPGDSLFAEYRTNVVSEYYTYYDMVIPSGTMNGVNTTFSLPQTPYSLQIYYNGALQINGIDFILEGANIIFVNAPNMNDNIYVYYTTISTIPEVFSVINTITNISNDPVLPIGIATNGIPFYGPANCNIATLFFGENLSTYNTFTVNEVFYSNLAGYDLGLGITDDSNGALKYYVNPTGMYVMNSSNHSPLLGFAIDGNPIYGPYGYDEIIPNANSYTVILNTSSYQLKTAERLNATGNIYNGMQMALYANTNGQYIEDFTFVPGSGTLNENNGRFCITPEYPNGTFAYFATIDIHGNPVYPYLIGPTFRSIPYNLKNAYINNVPKALYPNGNIHIPYTNVASILNMVRSPDGSASSDEETLLENIYTPWKENYPLTLTDVVVTNPGSGFVNIAANVYVENANAYLSSLKVVYANISNIGSNYSNHDVLTLTNNVANIVVNSVYSNGAIKTYSMTPYNNVSVILNRFNVSQYSTTGTGSGAQFNLDFGASEITIVSANTYTSIPEVSISYAYGNTYANILPILDNPYIRQIDSTIRFDRVDKNVEKINSNVYYPIGSIVYDYANTKFVEAMVANASISMLGNANVWTLASGESISTSTAENRIFSAYNPNSSMFGNVNSLLMSGCSYSGIVVGDEQFAINYDVPTGSIYDEDEGDASNVVLNLAWRPSQIQSSAFSSEFVRFGNTAGVVNSSNDQYFSITNNCPNLAINSNNFTLEFYCNFTNIASSVLIDTRNSSGSTTGFVIGNDAGTITFNDSSISMSSNIAITSNVWNFIVVNGTGNAISMYVNGNLSAMSSEAYNYIDTNLTIGADVTGDNVSNVYIDEMRFTVNHNRYSKTNTIDLPSSPFSRDINVDPYLLAHYTPILYGFETFNNESEANVTFQCVNADHTINDLSWNTKTLNLIGYGSSNLVVDGTSLNSNISKILSVKVNN